MSVEGCNEAVAAYVQACGDQSVDPHVRSLHNEGLAGEGGVEGLATHGCYIQWTGRDLLAVEYTPAEHSGGGCLSGHAPLCRLGVEEPSQDCQVEEAHGVACVGVGEVMIICLVCGSCCLSVCGFFCCCHDRKGALCPPKWAGCCRGGLCCSSRSSTAMSRSLQHGRGGVVTIGVPVSPE
eukprot:TRINITY_DN123749_c0_g1_i1.p1 TRINITY_DN123749_c0_g1~~TRINITY_DN123749_c0_g1_i1.p1  ORF type:complete len:180 (+),score=12.11 TRINITY_DN123749_c0_g1_i1:279-818(+)